MGSRTTILVSGSLSPSTISLLLSVELSSMKRMVNSGYICLIALAMLAMFFSSLKVGITIVQVPTMDRGLIL